MKKIKEMTLPELLIAWDESKRKLEEVKKPEYINNRVKEIFGDKKYYSKETLNQLINNIMEA